MAENCNADVLDAAASDGPRRPEWRNSNGLQDAIINSAKVVVLTTDLHGIIQLFNVGAVRMLGYSASEVVNRLTAVALHDPQELGERAQAVSRELSTTIAPGFNAVTCKASRGAEDCYESTLIRKNGEHIAVAIAISVLRDDVGCISGYALIITDSAVGKQAEVGPHEAASRSRQRHQFKPHSLTRMSHEMRTPLSAILGFTQLIESGSPTPTVSQKQSIDRILQAGWHLDKLITIARDLALIESGILSLSLDSVPLAAMMRDCQSMSDREASARAVSVAFPVFETPCFVSADRVRLREVFGYVLSAAIEHSEKGGAVVIDCDTQGSEWIRIGITERGEALSATRVAQHRQSAEALEQTANAADGTGIGLLLAKRLIESMGGAIIEDGAGCGPKVFSFDLKRALVPTPAGRSATHSIASEHNHSWPPSIVSADIKRTIV